MANATCHYIRSYGNSTNTLCPNTGVSTALPGPAYYDENPRKFRPAKYISNASIVVNVSAIANCAGDFKIGICEWYDGVTYTYNASEERTKLPLIVVVPQQCAEIQHLKSERVRTSLEPCVGDPSITVDMMLIGDYCKEQPTSKHCAAGTYNPKATSQAPSTGKQRLLAALSTLAIAAVVVM